MLLQLKNQSSGSKTAWFFIILILKSYDLLKSRSSCILLNKNINCNKNQTELKIENPTHSFRETILVLQLIWESQIKSKTMMRWSLWNKKEGSFCIFWRNFFLGSVFYLKHKHYFIHFLLAFKIFERLHCILKAIIDGIWVVSKF